MEEAASLMNNPPVSKKTLQVLCKTRFLRKNIFIFKMYVDVMNSIELCNSYNKKNEFPTFLAKLEIERKLIDFARFGFFLSPLAIKGKPNQLSFYNL